MRKFNTKIKSNRFPFSEYEQEILSLEKEIIKKVEIIISNRKTIEICNNKINTYEFLRSIKINSPKLIKYKYIKKNLPIIIKKKYGSGSKFQSVIKDKNLVPKKNDKKFIYQKFYNYQEYGMDILNDLNGNFLHFSVLKKMQ